MNSADSNGITAIMASVFGVTTRWIGSIDIMRSPSSCSVATIVPISAVVAEPARPVASSAVSTGPSSRISDRPTTAPSESLGAEAHQGVVALQPEHHADRQSGDADDHQRQHAEVEHLVDERPDAWRRGDDGA